MILKEIQIIIVFECMNVHDKDIFYILEHR